VDGDILLYRCAFAAEKTHYLVTRPLVGMSYEGYYQDSHKAAKAFAQDDGEFIWSRKEIKDKEFALHACNTTLESIVSRFDSAEVEIYLSDSPCFRTPYGKTKPYKGNRVDAVRPVYYDDVREFLLQRGAIRRLGLEADDWLAIEATKDPKGTIMVTTDKDLLQVPGNHYNWVTQEYITQSKKNADYALATQLITGDVTDNIPGLSGFGPRKAKDLLEGAVGRKDLFGRVFKAYQEKHGANWENYLSEQIILVRLLRSEAELAVLETFGPSSLEASSN
jgi:hypothetical protein